MDRERARARRVTNIGLLTPVLAFSGLGFGVILVTAAPAAATPACNLSVSSENLANNSVQTAINSANPGWTICVGAGTYPEQLQIHTNGLHLKGAGAGSTFIAPASVVRNTFDWDSAVVGTPTAPLGMDAILYVNNSTGVKITGFTVDGASAASSIGGCSPDFVGVDYQNSTGTLSGVTVKNIELAPALLGCQNQLAVYAYTGFFGTGFTPISPYLVTISGVSVSNYGKNGITCDDPGMDCQMVNDHVTGLGGTNATAQNGIQVAYDAFGNVVTPTVTQTNYTAVPVGGCSGFAGSTINWYGCGVQASGILFYLAAAGSTVKAGHFNQNPMAIVDFGPNLVRIIGNVVTNATGYGIVVNGASAISTTYAFIGNNTISSKGDGGVGILVDNASANLTQNKISWVSNTHDQGASQAVCAPSGTFLVCPTTHSVSTAAIQGVSESSVGATSLTLYNNVFTHDATQVATLGVLGGSVNVNFV